MTVGALFVRVDGKGRKEPGPELEEREDPENVCPFGWLVGLV